MKQLTYHITDFKDGSFERMINEVLCLAEYKKAAQVLVLMFEQNWDKDRIRSKISDIKSSLLKARICGATHFDRVDQGFNFDEHTVFTFLLFEEASFDITISYDRGFSEQVAGKGLNTFVKQHDDVKGIIAFGSRSGEISRVIFEGILDGFPDVPVFGGIAAVSTFFRHFGGVCYVFDEDQIRENAVLLIVLCGKSLEIKTSYNFGWTSVGNYMEITGTDGEYTITEIDHKPAAEIYKKYLGIDYKTTLISSLDISKFPTTIERDGKVFARIPMEWRNDGRLEYALPIKKGDRLRFSYGVPEGIFTEIYDDSMDYADFVPDAMLLSVCVNRMLFLKEEEKREIDYYKRVKPELAYFHGNAELLMKNDFGGVLNSALVTFGMREGACDRDRANEIKQVLEASKEKVNLTEYSMMNFMKAVTADLQDMTDKAHEASKAKSSFLSKMSHEIRTPINAVIGMDEMILRESHERVIREYANDVQNAGRTLLSMINDILDLSRINAGNVTINPVNYGLASILQDVVQIVLVKIKEGNLEFVINVDSDLPTVLFGDDVKIKQIMTNILLTAVRFTDEGKIIMNVTGERDHDELILKFEVTDPGCEVKKENIPQILEALESDDETGKSVLKDAGIPMTIACHLLKMMGSKLEIDSEYKKWTKTWFLLRQKIVDVKPLGNFEERFRRNLATKYMSSFKAPEAKILVADDNAMNLKVFTRLLKETGIQITTATCGAEGLTLSKQEKYDLIFLDHMMPDVNGIEVMEKIRSDDGSPNRHTGIVALSANAASGSRDYYKEIGFDNFLEKPINPKRMERMLYDMLPSELIIKVEGERDSENSDRKKDDFVTVEGMDFSYARMHLPKGYVLIEIMQDFYDSLYENADKLEAVYSEMKELIGIDDDGELDANKASQYLSTHSAKDDAFRDALRRYELQTHSMKSSSATIGIMILASMANRLELAVHNYEMDVISSIHSVFIDSWRDYKEKLGKFLPDSLKLR